MPQTGKGWPMYTGRIVSSQLIDFLPRHQLDKCVRRYRGNYRTKTFSCFDQYLCMAFAQITYRHSLRDIETCLRAMQSKLYHCGIRGNVSRNTLANANENRDWRLPTSLLSQGRQDNWPSMRSNDKTQRLLCFTGLSCYSATNRLFRHRNGQKVYIPNEQFYSVSLDNCSTLQMPLADRNLFQVDQTISSNQNIFWHRRECDED